MIVAFSKTDAGRVEAHGDAGAEGMLPDLVQNGQYGVGGSGRDALPVR